MTGNAVDARPSNRWLYAAIALLLALSVSVQAMRDRGWTPFVPPNPTLWLQSGPMAGKLALGFRNLVADAYWMRAVVYYGGRRQLIAQAPAATTQPTNFDLLYPLLDLVTSLDPHFKVAYRFGAIFLTEAYPSGPGRPDQAIQLLQRGIDQDAARWEYMEDIGFVYYWWVRDFHRAAEWFKRAGEQPGAPTWLAPLAAYTLAEGGDRRSSRFLWTQILENSDIEWLRRNAVTRLQQLDAMDAIEALNRSGAPLRGIVPDPTGVPYVVDPVSGRIDLDRNSSLWPLPWEPGAVAKPPS